MNVTVAKLSKKAAAKLEIGYVCKVATDNSAVTFLIPGYITLVMTLADYIHGVDWSVVERAIEADGVWQGDLIASGIKADGILRDLKNRYGSS